MRTEISQKSSLLSRLAAARSVTSRRAVEASSVDGRRPTFFAAREVIADARDDELLRQLVEHGGRIKRAAHEPGIPGEFRELGLGRDEELDLSGLPQTVVVAFDRIEDVPDVDDRLARAQTRAERVAWTSEPARALGALIAPLRADGHRVVLNAIGEPDTLPLASPSEGALGNPLEWGWTRQASRIAAAWQLFDSVRSIRPSTSAIEFIAISDSGFFQDRNPAPGSWGAETLADIGAGLVAWDAARDRAGLPAGAGSGGFWHGTSVASLAAAAVGNGVGAAGSGGLVARPCFFYSDYSQDSFMTTVIRSAQWGIPTANFSWGHEIDDRDELFDNWYDVLEWGAANGVLVVCSAGNAGRDLGTFTRFPTNVNTGGLTIGALNADDTARSDSNYGGAVHLWSPGTDLLAVANAGSPGGAGFGQTSGATPIVSGIAAMVHAIDPSLSVADRRQLLLDTAWPSGDPKVSAGLDAYAAVWRAAQGRMAESGAEVGSETLFVRSDGTFTPIFSNGFNQPGDVDELDIDVTTISDLRVDLEWYDDLADVAIRLTNAANGESVRGATVATPAPGQARLAARLGPGRYRLRLSGSGPTATLLRGTLVPTAIGPDQFEPNDTFKTATRLIVARPTDGAFRLVLFGHGPGSFDLTLHSNDAPPATDDVDMFVIDAPAQMGRYARPEIQLTYSDEPVTLTLYDDAHNRYRTLDEVRTARIGIAEGRRIYLEVRGARHTRYGLWVGAGFDVGDLQDRYEQLVPVGTWWEDPHPDWRVGLEFERSLAINPELLDDGVLEFGAAGSAVLPEGLAVELLDAAGEVVRTAERGHRSDTVGSTALIDLAGLTPGAYVIRAVADEETLAGLTAAPIALEPRAPEWRE